MRMDEGAVSEVVGEMLLIGIVLILVAIFAASISAFIPDERAPVVNIKMNCSYNSTLNQTTIELWHKGGDWVRASDITVMLRDNESVVKYLDPAHNPDQSFLLLNATGSGTGMQTYGLGDRIRVIREGQAETGLEVRMMTETAVFFSAEVA